MIATIMTRSHHPYQGRNTLECIVHIHCMLLTALKDGRENQFWLITFEITLRVMAL